MSQLNFAAEAATPAHIATVTANQLLPGWIRRRRKSLDMTQADLAQRLACSISTIQKVEEGERRPSKTLATHLMEALEIAEGERPVFMRLARARLTRSNPTPRNAGRSEECARSANNTPFPINALIGREVESAWIGDLLTGDDARWVTLTGLPGVGKTRLAQHIAHSVQFEDGVCYVSLAGLPAQSETEAACAAITQAICNALQTGASVDVPLFNATPRDAPDALIAHLRELHLLLVLDNFEHLLAARDLLIRLLQETRWVKLLITSRERLRLRAEHVVRLSGLPVEDGASPALQLFMARASRVSGPYMAGPAFAEKHAAQKMARICRLVDGLPLGIEMACELMATQSLDEIGDAIERDLNVLHSTSPDVPEAHRNLRVMVASVWAQLSLDEQRVVAQCAAFPGGFGFEEANQAIRFDEEPDGCNPLRTMLDALIEKSLIRRVVDDATKQSLYLLHPLLRRFAVSSQTPDP